MKKTKDNFIGVDQSGDVEDVKERSRYMLIIDWCRNLLL